MATCVNCKDTAEHAYLGIQYCNRHLPRFLRNANGKPKGSVTKIVAAPQETKLFEDRVVEIPTAGEVVIDVKPEEEVVVEEVVEEVPSEVPSPATVASKKKAATKAD